MSEFAVLPQKVDEIIVQLHTIFKVLKMRENKVKVKQTLVLNEALEFLLEEGFEISKSTLYKRTSKNSIPCKRFGSRLLFDRDELLKWCNDRTATPESGNQVISNLVLSANRKVGHGKR